MSPTSLIAAIAGILGAFALVPVLIHLINMLRHRRVQWAAMDFLLQSYRRHRNWIWLKQLLLLAMRMAVMVLLAFMLFSLLHTLLNDLSRRIGFDESVLGAALGGRLTHHYVLVDDSYSMADRIGSMTAFERARRTILTIARRAGRYDNQRFTLIRYSQAANATRDAQDQLAELVDLNAIEVDQDFEQLLEERRSQIDVSQLSVGPVPALNVVGQLLRQRPAEQPIVYLVSDFRAVQWDNPAEIAKSCQALHAAGAELQLINCVRAPRPNLAITQLVPENDVRAAGVPLFLNIKVRNFGREVARKVQVRLRAFAYNDQDLTAANDPVELLGQTEGEELPTVYFEQIQPGQEASNRLQVYFPQPGQHVVQASLQEDPLPTDNQHWCVVRFVESVPVLIVDGGASGGGGYYLSAAFDPGGRKNTGIQPELRSVSFLRDATPDALAMYASIYLADVTLGQLNARTIQNLEAWVRRGGGLGIFVGGNVDPTSYNLRLYREGAGLLPCPLDKELRLDEPSGPPVSDISFADHPIFEPLRGDADPLLGLISIDRYLRPPLEWSADQDNAVQVIAQLRNGDPLMVERRCGDGRVILFTSTLSPQWNNWARNPTFVILALKLQAHLAGTDRQDRRHTVGAPIQLRLDAEQYRNDVTFVVPTGDATGHVTIDRQAARPAESASQVEVAIGQPNPLLNRGETDLSGIYEAWAFAKTGLAEVHRYAVNVDPLEGNLAVTDETSLLAELEAVKPTLLHWDEVREDVFREAGFGWGKWILLSLVLLLVLEQLLAYALSFHPSRGVTR